MKKLLSLILVISLVMAFSAVGITSASAEDKDYPGFGVLSSSSKSKFAHALLDNAISITPGTSFKLEIKTAAATDVNVVFGTGVTDTEGSTAYTVPSYASFESKTTGTDWETLSFAIPADNSKIDWTKVNYISVRSKKNFTLKSEFGANSWSDILVSQGIVYIVKLIPGEGYTIAPAEGYSSPVSEGSKFAFTVSLSEGYLKTADFSVKANGTAMTPEADGVTYTIPAVNANTEITVTGVAAKAADNETGSNSAYLYEGKAKSERKSGFYLDTDCAVEMAGKEGNYTFDGWVYISNVESYFVIMQLYGTAPKTGKYSNSVEYWAYRFIMSSENNPNGISLNAGWNHIVVPISKFKSGTSENGNTKEAFADYEQSKKIMAVSFHENTENNYGKYSFAVANACIVDSSSAQYPLISKAGTKKVEDMKPTLGDNSSEFGIMEIGNYTPPEVEQITEFFIDSSEAVTSNTAGGTNCTLSGVKGWVDGRESGKKAFQVHTVASKLAVITNMITVSSEEGKKASFDYYVQDKNAVASIQWELASSGGYNGACIRYTMDNTHFDNGWNTIKFTLTNEIGKFGAYTTSLGTGMTGNVDYSKINFFRIINVTPKNSGTTDIAITSLRFNYDGDAAKPGDDKDDEKEDNKPTIQQFFINSSETVSSGAGTGTWDSERVTGYASYSHTPNKEVSTVVNRIEASGTIGTECFYYLYISDLDNLKVLQWEVASSGECRGACIRYQIGEAKIKQTLVKGWNKISFKLVDSSNLPAGQFNYGVFSDLYGVGLGGGMTGNVDYSKINYFRFVFQTKDVSKNLNLKINCLQIGSASGSTGDTTPVMAIALAMLAAAIIAGGVYFYNKKKAQAR